MDKIVFSTKDGITLVEDTRYLYDYFGTKASNIQLYMEFDRRLSLDSEDKILYDIIAATKKDSKNPLLKFYLSIAYIKNDMESEGVTVLENLIKDNPSFILAKTYLIHHFLKKSEVTPELLHFYNEDFDIVSATRGRKIFHSYEYYFFYEVVAYYHLRMNPDIESVHQFIEKLEETEPDSDNLKGLKWALEKRYRQEESDEIVDEDKNLEKELEYFDDEAIVKFQIPKTFERIAPTFNHPEIECLYQHSVCNINKEQIDALLALPRTTLIADLELVLKDAVVSFWSLYNEIGPENDKKETISFALHALSLLAELEAIESLPAILHFLSYNFEMFDFYTCTLKNEELSYLFFKFANRLESLDILTDFLKEPYSTADQKILVAMGILQIWIHDENRKAAIEQYFHSLFSYYKHCSKEESVFLIGLFGYLSMIFSELSIQSFKPIIIELYEQDYIDDWFTNLEDLLKEYENPIQGNEPCPTNIHDFYQSIIVIENRWRDLPPIDEATREQILKGLENLKNKPLLNEVKGVESNNKPIITSVKVGRNDPCPCGSGKKYKKCCGQNS